MAVRTEPDAVVLEVRDTGAGIPADELPHIWERFYRGRSDRSRAGDGAGLGLALVNYYKLLLRGDPLLFADIRLISEATAIGGRYTFTVTGGVAVAALLTVGLSVLLRCRYPACRRPHARQRLLGIALCLSLLFHRWG